VGPVSPTAQIEITHSCDNSMEMSAGVEVMLHSFRTLALDRSLMKQYHSSVHSISNSFEHFLVVIFIICRGLHLLTCVYLFTSLLETIRGVVTNTGSRALIQSPT
jgi:hypothetical protein